MGEGDCWGCADGDGVLGFLNEYESERSWRRYRYLISLAFSILGILSFVKEIVEDDGQLCGQLATKYIRKLYW